MNTKIETDYESTRQLAAAIMAAHDFAFAQWLKAKPDNAAVKEQLWLLSDVKTKLLDFIYKT